MTLEDLDAVLTIELASFSEPWTRSALASELAAPGAAAFVMSTAPRPAARFIIAYVLLRVLIDEIHVMRIAVRPGWRNQGAASRLMRHAIASMGRPPMRSFLLEVRAGNLPAFRFYRAMGFREIGRRKGYYSKTGEDAIVMKRDI
jgi:ribosomal-protein-alanine N-acetyltransferase